MQCPKCGLVNAAGARFCKQCGQSLPAASSQPPTYSAPPAPPPPPVAQPAYPQTPPQGYGPAPSPQPLAASPNAWGSPVAQQAYAPMTSVRQVRRISPKSAFKVAAAIYGLIYGVVGLFGFLISLIGILAGSRMLSDLGVPVSSGIVGILSALLVYILGTLLVALVGGVVAAIIAFIYNMVAGRIGGLEVEVA